MQTAATTENPQSFYLDNVTINEITDNLTAGLQPDVMEHHDYDPFGMQVAQRSTPLGKYRYGFQGQEKDNEIKGIDGSSLNYTFRMHDPRIGRFFAVDPLTKKYPFYSPYSFSGNRVIDAVELEGLEPSKKGSAEGQQESAFANSDEYFEEHPLNLIGWLSTYQVWTWHEGTTTNAKDWYSEDKYTQIIAPFAIDYAMLDGWRIGLDWQSAKDLVGNAPGSGHSINDATTQFMDRNWDGKAYANFPKVGAKLINDINRNTYSSARGLTEPMEFTSPFFGVGIGLKAIATGEAAGELAATVGSSTTSNYRETFFLAYPDLEGQVVIHHAVEQQVLTRYELFTESEIHSLENLRGIPKELNNTVHLSQIRKEWNIFYKSNPNPTKQMFLDKATEIDKIYGKQFLPPR